MKLYLGSETLLYLIGLTDPTTGAFVSGATVTAKIVGPDGTIAGTVTLDDVGGPVNVDGVSAAGGNYRGQLDNVAAADLVDGWIYAVQFLIVDTNGNQATIVESAIAGFDGSLMDLPDPESIPDIALGSLAGDIVGTGSGVATVNSNTGGTDALKYTDAVGNGIANAVVLIYLAIDYPNNPGRVQAKTTTAADGSWGPVFVSHGVYVAVISGPGSSLPDISNAFTV